jgi:16S rRNA (uracil1498-N3)-methyltransferase
VSKGNVLLEITSRRDAARERRSRLELAVAMPKGDRADWLVEKLTELGVARLIPLRTQRSVVRPGAGKLDRWRRIVVAASKQCGRNQLMEIAPLTDWPRLVSDPNLPRRRLIVDPDGPAATWYASELIAAIGPEGGWTDEELALANDAGWQRVGLGPRILRIETAAIVCASLAQD